MTYRCFECGKEVQEGEILETPLPEIIYGATEKVCPRCLEEMRRLVARHATSQKAG